MKNGFKDLALMFWSGNVMGFGIASFFMLENTAQWLIPLLFLPSSFGFAYRTLEDRMKENGLI